MTPREAILQALAGFDTRRENIAEDFVSAVLDALQAAGYGILPATEAKPAAWLDDGTLRAGSERTAHRVVTDEQKRDMPNAVRSSFDVPLYRGMPAAEVEGIQDTALEAAARIADDRGSRAKTIDGQRTGAAIAAAIRSLKGAKS